MRYNINVAYVYVELVSKWFVTLYVAMQDAYASSAIIETHLWWMMLAKYEQSFLLFLCKT
jgi:hypothetical protein